MLRRGIVKKGRLTFDASGQTQNYNGGCSRRLNFVGATIAYSNKKHRDQTGAHAPTRDG
jgi:hypothetical protein